MPHLRRLVAMLAREALGPSRLERRPEPTALMEESVNVEAFHDQGAASGPLLPVYRFNALATSRLVRSGGTVLDLGSGSGQYLAYLAARRPDLTIVGFDLSSAMVRRARSFFRDEGLAERIEMRIGDMTNFFQSVPERVDLVSSVFALHHLESSDDLRRCLRQIAAIRERDGCAIWIFDHARPRDPRTPEIFPEIFTPNAPLAFRNDSRNSLIASYSFDELMRALDDAGLRSLQHRLARWMRFYQLHWMACDDSCRRGDVGRVLWRPDVLSDSAKREFRALRALFPDLSLVRD